MAWSTWTRGRRKPSLSPTTRSRTSTWPTRPICRSCGRCVSGWRASSRRGGRLVQLLLLARRRPCPRLRPAGRDPPQARRRPGRAVLRPGRAHSRQVPGSCGADAEEARHGLFGGCRRGGRQRGRRPRLARPAACVQHGRPRVPLLRWLHATSPRRGDRGQGDPVAPGPGDGLSGRSPQRAYCQTTGWRGAIWQRSRLVIGRLGVRVPSPAPGQRHLPALCHTFRLTSRLTIASILVSRRCTGVAIYERRDGWEVRVYAGVDPVTGKPHRISRQVDGSRRKAEREETRLKAQVMDGRHRGARAKTLAELVDTYLDWREHNDKPIGPRTLQGYRALADARIKPGLGKLRLPQVDPPALDRFYMALRKNGSLRKPGEPLSASRLRDVHAVISGALALAARYGWISYGPARSAPCGGATSTWTPATWWSATTSCTPGACRTATSASEPRAATAMTGRSPSARRQPGSSRTTGPAARPGRAGGAASSRPTPTCSVRTRPAAAPCGWTR